MKHKKWPIQFEWNGEKETFDQVVDIITNDLKEHGLGHFNTYETLTHDNQVETPSEPDTPTVEQHSMETVLTNGDSPPRENVERPPREKRHKSKRTRSDILDSFTKQKKDDEIDMNGL
jgi:hypothetical protein